MIASPAVRAGMLNVDAFFGELDAALRAIPSQPVAVQGEWSTTTRRTSVEVIDRRWAGTLSCASDVGAIGFLVHEGTIHWAKGSAISAALPLEIALHAYADRLPGRATFSASLASAFLPGVPVVGSARPEGCTLGPPSIVTGRVARLAEADGAALFALVLPRAALKMGRNHLWRVRDDVAAALAPSVRELLTRGRSGRVVSSSSP